MKEAMDTGGENLVEGLSEMLDDMQNNGGYPKQVDNSAFTLGENLAATKGEIVFRNELFELIAYTPQTEDGVRAADSMSPPWINKYYIMDLAPGRSFVEWAVSRGHQVFMISYRNPDASMRDYTMDTYFTRRLLTALDVVQKLTGAPQVNLASLCLGGTMSTLLLAYLAAKGEEHRIGSVTLTNTIVDFAEPGDLGVFTDETTIARLNGR